MSVGSGADKQQGRRAGNRWERREEREKTIPGNRLTHSWQDNRRDLAGGQISNTRGRQGETMAVTHNAPCLNRTGGGAEMLLEKLIYSIPSDSHDTYNCCGV